MQPEPLQSPQGNPSAEMPVQPEAQYQPQAAYEEAPSEPVEEQEDAQAVQWQAPEYIDHARTPLWYVAFWIVVIALMLVAAFVIKSWSFVILVPAMAAALMIYSHRPPRTLNYVLSQQGLFINDQLHPMTEFRSFGVLHEDAYPSVMLIPVKRFRPGLTVLFPVEYGESIVDLLGSRIPMKELQADVFDKIVRKLRM